MNTRSIIIAFCLVMSCNCAFGQSGLPHHLDYEWMTSPQPGYSPISFTYEGHLDSISNIHIKMPSEMKIVDDPIIMKTHPRFREIFPELSMRCGMPHNDNNSVLRYNYGVKQSPVDSANRIKYNRIFPEKAYPAGNNQNHIRIIMGYLQRSGADANYRKNVRYADEETAKRFNADSLIMFDLTLPAGEPFTDKYPYATGVVFTKKNYPFLPVFFFFSEQGVSDKQKYIDLLEGNIWYWNKRGDEDYDKKRDSLTRVRFDGVWGIPLHNYRAPGSGSYSLLWFGDDVGVSVPDDWAYIYRNECWNQWDTLRLTPVFGGQCFRHAMSIDKGAMVWHGGVLKKSWLADWQVQKLTKDGDLMKAEASKRIDDAITVIKGGVRAQKYPLDFESQQYFDFFTDKDSRELFGADRVLVYDLPLPPEGHEGYNYCKGVLINKGELYYRMYFFFNDESIAKACDYILQWAGHINFL